ncbi:MAG TPA: RND transporter [Thermosipho africanus]|nr:RND transporter [Thermosipho africanus]
MKKFIIFLVFFVISLVIIFIKGSIYTGPDVFLPGFKYGKSLNEIDNESVKNFAKLSKDFNDGNSLFVIIYSDNGFFNKENTKKLLNLTSELLNEPYISTIISPANFPKIVGFSITTYIKDNVLQKEILNDKNAANLISKDGKYSIINLTFKQNVDARKYIAKIEKHVKKFFENYYLFGEPVIDSELFKELLKQMYIYPFIMLLLILFFFYFQTKSPKVAFFSVFTPIVSSIFTVSILFLFNRPLNTLTVMIFSFLLIIGSGYGLHYYNAYFRIKDFEKTKKHIQIPIIFSMLTTVAGFLSFLFVNIESFKELGLLVSIGLIINVLLIFSFSEEIFKNTNPKKRPINFGIKYFGDKISFTLLIIFILIAIISPLLIKNISIKSDMISYFSKDSKIGKAYNIMEQFFNFREPIFLVLEKSSPFIANDNKKIKNILETLENTEYVSNTNFPIDIPIPILYNFSKNNPLLKYYISSNSKIRIIINLTKKGYENIDEILNILKEITPYKYYVAGSALIWNDINKNILNAQIKSIIFAGILIFAMVFIIFKSIRITLSVIIPIGFTTLFNFIFMTIFKINLDVSTSITSSILMGLVIDYSIHLANDEKNTKSPEKSIINVGPPILANGIGLILGFSVLLFSSLKLFKSIALLIIFGILIGLIFTLIIQPFILKKLTLINKIYRDLKK